jgi:predicted nucleic acid-binding protein
MNTDHYWLLTSLAENLEMADAIVLATAKEYGAKIVTSDHHFSRFQNVELIH